MTEKSTWKVTGMESFNNYSMIRVRKNKIET